MKGFVRQDSGARSEIQCKWRIPYEGLLEVLPHVPEDLVRKVTIRELKVFVGENYPTVSHSFAMSPRRHVLLTCPQVEQFDESVREWMAAAPVGNILVQVQAGEIDGAQYVLLVSPQCSQTDLPVCHWLCTYPSGVPITRCRF